MTDEIDLSGEQDPEERMAQLQSRSVPDDRENHRTTTHNGVVETEDFDLDDALEAL